MEGGRARAGLGPSDLLFTLVTTLVAALGLSVFHSLAPSGEPVGFAVGGPTLATASPSAMRAEPTGAEVALNELLSARPALFRAGPRVLSQDTGMMVSAPISLPPGTYELWLGCVGDGQVRLSIFTRPAGSGAGQMHVVAQDCVAEEGIYHPQAVDPAGEFPAFHPPDSSGLHGREGATGILVVPDDRFQTATVQLSAVAALPVTAAWRLSGESVSAQDR